MYLITQCYSCGNVLIVQVGQKTKLCTYCNTRLSVSRMKALARAESTSEARRIAIYLKSNQNNP